MTPYTHISDLAKEAQPPEKMWLTAPALPKKRTALGSGKDWHAFVITLAWSGYGQARLMRREIIPPRLCPSIRRSRAKASNRRSWLYLHKENMRLEGREKSRK